MLYAEYVQYPSNILEAETRMEEFIIAGLHGAMGSMYACHVTLEKCSHRFQQNHVGVKGKQICRSFNLTANHRHQSLHTRSGHPFRWNDMIIVLLDGLACKLSHGEIMQDNIFLIYDKDENRDTISFDYCGACLLVGNVYLNWGVTIPPMKNTPCTDETQWCEWLESMRKDVECTFGILKGCFRILKAGIMLHGVDAADNIWKICCALHYLLFDREGRSDQWDGEMSLFDFDNDADADNIPFALRRLV